MKDSFLFNISNKEGLPGGANEQTNNVFGAMSLVNNSGPRASTNEDIDQDAMLGMMKARMAYEEMHGNPAAKRMVVAPDNPYQFDNGDTGTHYMGSYGDYAVPNIQEVDGKLEMTGPIANEEMKFDRPEDAAYFSENYKKIAPDSSYREFEELELTDDEIEEYRAGGYVVEEFNEGGDNGKKSKYITNIMNLLEQDGVLPLDLVYGNEELGIPKMGTLEGLKSIPELKDYFFDPSGDMMNSYIEQRGNPEEREAATKAKRENYLSNVGRTEKEDTAFENKRMDKLYEEAEKKQQAREQEYTAADAQREYQRRRDYDDSGQFIADVGQGLKDIYGEATGIYGAGRTFDRIKKDPIEFADNLITTTGDIMKLPFTAGKELYDVTLGDGKFEIDNVVDANALETSLDFVGSLPFIGMAGKAVGTGGKLLKTGQLASKLDDAIRVMPGAQSFNSGPGSLINDVRSGVNELRYAVSSKPKVPVEKGLKYKYSRVPERLDHIKGTGQYWDEVGIPGNEITHPDMLTYRGTRTGRPVVDIKMPDGSTASFYKSSGWAKKQGVGKAGTTEGLWQPFGGFSDNPTWGPNWFIKDGDYLNWYGSKTYKDMAYSLDDALMKKFGAKNVDELDNMINFKRMNRPGDDFIPGYPHGGEHNWMNPNYTVENSYSDDGNTYTELITDRKNDSYEYKREKDKTTGDINYFSRKRGTDTWNTAGEEGTTGYRAVTDLFGEDNTGYATSDQRKDFIRGELVKRAEEKAKSEEQPKVESTTSTEQPKKQYASIYDAVLANSDSNYNPEVIDAPSDEEAVNAMINKQPIFGGPSSGNTVVAGGSDFYNRDKSASTKVFKIDDGLTAKEAAKEFVDASIDNVKAFTVDPIVRTYNKGAKKVIGDFANTAADIVAGTGEAIYEAGDYLVGDGSFDMSDTNWMTGNEYGSGLDTVLDVASVIPAAKFLKAGKLVSPLVSGTTKTLSKGKNAFVKGAQASTDYLGDIRLGTVGSQPLTVGDIGNYVHKGLKYKKVAPNTGIGSVDKFTDKWASGYGILGGMGVDATVRGDNTYSDIFSGNYDPTKSAIGRLSINAADDLSLINESRKNASIQNVIDDGYSFNDALKVGINLSPFKAIRSMAGEERLGQTIAGAPQAVTKFSKKLTDKSGGIDNKTDYSSPRTVYLGAQRQEGGTVQEQYLTEAEIAALEAQGYRIEDIS